MRSGPRLPTGWNEDWGFFPKRLFPNNQSKEPVMRSRSRYTNKQRIDVPASQQRKSNSSAHAIATARFFISRLEAGSMSKKDIHSYLTSWGQSALPLKAALKAEGAL